MVKDCAATFSWGVPGKSTSMNLFRHQAMNFSVPSALVHETDSVVSSLPLPYHTVICWEALPSKRSWQTLALRNGCLNQWSSAP